MLKYAIISLFSALLTLCAAASETGPLSPDLLSGDFIFRVGRSHFTPIFSAANKETGLTHVGVIMIDHGQCVVYHADGGNYPYEDAIQKTPLPVFIQESSRYEIRRNRMPQLKKLEFLEEIVRLYAKRIPFDSEFRLDDDGKKLYCTEYLWKAAQTVGISLGSPISFWGRKGLLVDTIYTSPLCGETLKKETFEKTKESRSKSNLMP